MRLQDEDGFTLIEIVIALAIIGILAAIAVPNFLEWLPNMRLKAASRDLYSNLQMARGLAVKTNAETAVVFDTVNNLYYLCDDSGADGNWASANDLVGTGDNNILEIVDLAGYQSGVGYGHATVPANNSATTPSGAFPADDVSYANNVVLFNSMGLGNAGYVYLENEKDTVYAVGTQTSGVIMLKKWNGGVWQ